jgi:hypothetical protein
MPRYKPNWKCTKCDHSCNFIEDTIQDWFYLPFESHHGEPNDVGVCGIRCPQCNDLQGIRTKGTILAGTDTRGYRNMNGACVLGTCYCLICQDEKVNEGVKFATELYDWGLSVVSHCINCGTAKDSRFTDFILFRGEKMEQDAKKLEKRKSW